ncbi:MAG: RluA family pseudouridine synthase [Anaerolineae bacterium]|nr:RluA family pseudouridine synthase [Anaerolineae bacterium]
MAESERLRIETATRLDQALVVAWPTLDSRQIRDMVTAGGVLVNGERAQTAGQRLDPGDSLVVRLPAMISTSVAQAPPGLGLPVVYEDDHVLAIDKPAGIAVRSSRKSGFATAPQLLATRFPERAHIGGVDRSGVVTALGDDESGLMLIAKDEATYRELRRLVKRQRVQETYTALVEGNLRGEFTIDQAIGNAKRVRERLTVSREGRPAVTNVKGQQHLKDSERDYTVVLVRPLTARLHQIRLHLAWYGYPIVGDRIYGTRRQAILPDRIFLHLSEIRFPHPETGNEVRVEAQLAPELYSLLAYLRRPR